MAPEILDYLDIDATKTIGYTNAVDLWAVGCIAYRLISGAVPFLSGRQLIRYCNDPTQFPLSALLDSHAKETCLSFIQKLLVPSPKERLTAVEALESLWIGSGSYRYIISRAHVFDCVYELRKIHPRDHRWSIFRAACSRNRRKPR